MSLDGFSMHRLVNELRASLLGARIDKITQPNRQTIQLNLRQPGRNHLLYISINSQNPIMYRLRAPLENLPQPPVFCMVLRKYLEAGRVAAIEQNGLDRLVRLDIDCLGNGGRIVTRTLVAEFMGKYSNLILVEDGIILDALRRIGAATSRVRLVLPGIPYEIPPGQEKLNVLTAPPADILREIRRRSERKLAAAISDVCLGFGPVTAKEIAFSAGLAADSPVASLDDADFSALSTAFKETLSAAISSSSLPCLITKDGRLQAMAAFQLHYLTDGTVETFANMDDMLARAAALIGSYVPPDKERFRKLVHNELSRARGKAEKLRQEITAADDAETAKIIADNLMICQYQLADHADAEVTIPDIYSSTEKTLTVPLDQRLTINQNIQNYYRKYNKLKRAQGLLRKQIAECEDNIRYLSSIEASLEASATLAELNDIRSELVAGGWLKEKISRKGTEKTSQPFRFLAPDGTEILVGKNNYQNDRLTFKTARHDDIWLHTKDIPGSHVILRCDGGDPSPAALELAACLAAHFSQAAGSSNVPVDYTLCRFVKKPSGSRPGFVIFTNQKTLYVTPDKNRLIALRQGEN